MQKCEDGIKEKRSGVNGDNSLYCCSVQPGTYVLTEDRRIEINHGTNILEIKNGEASMIEADCPDQICVHEKAISADGESIICLPNKIVVEVESDKESELDAVMK